MNPSPRQLNVGTCPKCGKYPTWFNNVPLMAYCWGTDGNEHPETKRIVTGELQPYGIVSASRWVVARKIVAFA